MLVEMERTAGTSWLLNSLYHGALPHGLEYAGADASMPGNSCGPADALAGYDTTLN